MPIKRLTAAALLAATLAIAAPVQASPDDTGIPQPQMPVFNPAQALAQSTLPSNVDSLLNLDRVVEAGGDLRQALVALAMNLRDIRYVRGGSDPSTGFDCSGFVRYVFAHAVGLRLPANSASQFLAGLKVRRDEMQPGDLVFFRTGGHRGVSHVGIYLSNGQFIHSPSRGETVKVSSLDEAYWAKRFVGARRPEGIARNG